MTDEERDLFNVTKMSMRCEANLGCRADCGPFVGIWKAKCGDDNGTKRTSLLKTVEWYFPLLIVLLIEIIWVSTD